MLDVEVYTQPNCQPCKAVKGWFDRHGVTYTDVDVRKDSDALQRIFDMGYKSTPVVIVWDSSREVRDSWQGLNMKKMQNLL